MTDIPKGYCEDCFGNEKLKAHIRQVLDSGTCQGTQCGQHNKAGVCQETIRDAVRRAIGARYLISSNPGQKETGWLRAPEAVGKTIGSSCNVLRNEILRLCESRDSNHTVGDLLLYSNSSCKKLSESPFPDDVISQQYDMALWWRILCSKLRSSERYDGSVWNYLNCIMKEFEALPEGIPPLIRNSHEINVPLYRARKGRCDDAAEISEWRDPQAHLYFWFSPPPKKIATPGRMNAKGNPVYYVGFEEETAVAELRPNPGEIISVATIKLAQPINIIDLTATDSEEYNDHFNNLNEFDYDGWSKFMAFRFIKALSAKLTEPSGSDSCDTYLETQAFAEFAKHYLQNRPQSEEPIGGIVYSSAQRRSGKCLVIFCETLMAPANSAIEWTRDDGADVETEMDRVHMGQRLRIESQRIVHIRDVTATHDVLASPAQV